MGGYVSSFEEIDQTQAAVVGGKGAHLAALARIEGLRVHGTDGYVEILPTFSGDSS